jgi:hypothetical protein
MHHPTNALRLLSIRDLAATNLDKLQEVIGHLVAISSAKSLHEKVQHAVEALIIESELTPNDLDDKLSALAKQLRDSGALDVLVDLVERLLTDHHGAGARDAESLVAAESFAARINIDFAKLLEFALMIVKLLTAKPTTTLQQRTA